MMHWNKLAKASLMLLTLNLACFCSYGEAATVLAISPMGVTDSTIIAVAVDDNNNAVTVYESSQLIDSRYSPGNLLFEPAVTISNATPFKSDPDVAMDASSTALAVWVGDDTFGTVTIETNTLTAGVWGTPSILETSLVGNLVSPSVSMNGSGDGVAVWINQNTDQVHSSFYTAGAWTPFQLVGAPGDAGNGSVVDYSTNGTAATAWSHFDFGISDIFATIFNGLIWLPKTLLDNTGNSFPDIGIDASGNAIAIWAGNGVNDIRWSRYDGLVWSTPQTISLASGNGVPHIAVAPNGTAIAVWPDAGNNLEISQFNGTTWSLPVPVAPATDSAISMDSVGNAIIGWSINDQLYVAYLPLGGVLSQTVLITSGGLDINGIDLALSSGNNTGVASWREGGPEGGNTFATFILFALPAPTPPAGITGSVCSNSFASQSDRVHIITFDPSTDPLTVAYYIYRNGVLISIVPAVGPFTFYDHNRTKGSPDTYTVYAVNAEGTLSTPVSITLD